MSIERVKVTSLQPNFEKLTPESPKYDPLYAEIFDKFSTLQGETSQRITRQLENKNLYLGEHSEHWDEVEQIGDIHPIVNYIAAVDNKFADLLTAGEMPGIQCVAPSEEAKGYAQAGEALLYRILNHNFFSKKLHYASVDGSMLGDSFFYVYWDPENKRGGSKGSVTVENRSPFFIRVGFARDNWDEIDYWIGETKMTPDAIERKWGFRPKSQPITPASGQAGGSSKNAPFDSTPVESAKTYNPMVTVIEYHDMEKDAILIGDEAIEIKKNKGHHGLFHIRNRTAPNEPWGYPDHYNIKDPVKLMNRLHSKAQEIIDHHAAPMIVDKGGVLQGRRLKTRSNVVVTTQPYGPGEGLEYLQWNGNIFPIDKQISTVQQNIHDLSEMPPAAFGGYQPGTYSGYALQIQMQPTLMRVKIKQTAEWGPNLTEMFRYMLKLALENDSSIGLPKEVADYEIKIHWNSPVPREDAREIQNAVALVNNKLTSRESAMQQLQVEDVQLEMAKIDQETVRMAEVMAEAQVAQQGQIQGQGETALDSAIQPGQAPEQAFPGLPEDNRLTPQSTGLDQGESIAPTSTEGV